MGPGSVTHHLVTLSELHSFSKPWLPNLFLRIAMLSNFRVVATEIVLEIGL